MQQLDATSFNWLIGSELTFGIVALAIYLASVKLYKQFIATKQPVNTDKAVDDKAALDEPKLPDPTPLVDYDWRTGKTRNYVYVNKTVRFPYFQTMSHQPLNINDWVECDKNYEWYIQEKQRVIEKEGKRARDSLPENDEASAELLETVIDYLPKRYPTMFEAIPDGIVNKVTNVRYENCSQLKGIPALDVVAGLCANDFLMAREREDGHVYFVGGVVAFPGFYLLNEKIGKSMFDVRKWLVDDRVKCEALNTRASLDVPVPDFNEKLLLSVERTLKRFKSNEPFERSSWEIVDDWSLFRHNMVDLPEGTKLSVPPKDLLFRIDRQTFRKLPRTRAIIFGVHPILKRIEEFADDPLVPALLATVHEKGPEHLMAYKLNDMYQDELLPYLASLTQSQIDRGLITGTENVSDFRNLVSKIEERESASTAGIGP